MVDMKEKRFGYAFKRTVHKPKETFSSLSTNKDFTSSPSSKIFKVVIDESVAPNDEDNHLRGNWKGRQS